MLRAPLPDTPHVVSPAEVVFILRTAQPPALTFRLGGPAAIRGRAISLTPPAPGFTGVYFVAMQTLELGGRLHGRPRQKTHLPRPRTPARSPKSAQEEGPGIEEKRKKRAARKRRKKTPTPTGHPIFKPPVLSDFHFAAHISEAVAVFRLNGDPNAINSGGLGAVPQWSAEGSNMLESRPCLS